jgi:glucosamine--fructose-6-phosphate aminotransferase (isomerizing)
MIPSSSQMAVELRDAPLAVEKQAQGLARPLAALVARLRQTAPVVVVTCARGSSAHAATYGKHLIERYLGIPVAAAAPIICSVYGEQLRLKNQLFLAISQSGSSDDLIEQAISARAAGAVTTCIVNDTESPLAQACEFMLPMGAGAERSVAATKTFITSLTALARLMALWRSDADFGGAIDRLPERLSASMELDWSAALPSFAETDSLVTIGRGPTLAIAREAALKFKETCNLHAEPFSGAEFLHGPVALVTASYPLLLFMPTDAAAAGMRQLAEKLRAKGAALFSAEPGPAADGRLSALPADHPETDAIALIQSFYGFLPQLATARGTDVDRPPHLQKITYTR